jgi:PadR family transcriptional regulator, regulatory protein AphA
MSPMVKAPLTLEHALLGFLLAGPMHAYEMHHQLHQSGELGLVWRIKQSQLYALLARLEDVGYLTTTTAPQETRPARKMLHLTPTGREAFNAWLITPVAHGRELRQEFLAKLYFAQRAGSQVATQLVTAQRAALAEMLAELSSREESAELPYARLVYAFRQNQLLASLNWLDRQVMPMVCGVSQSASTTIEHPKEQIETKE